MRRSTLRQIVRVCIAIIAVAAIVTLMWPAFFAVE